MKLIAADNLAMRSAAPRFARSADVVRSAQARARRVRTSAVAGAAIAVTGLLGVAGCSGGDNAADGGGGGSGNPAGSLVDHPFPCIGSRQFIVDPNSGGSATSPRVVGLSWGRLANIYDSTGTLQARDMPIGQDIPDADPNLFSLEVNPITDETVITINAVAGTPAFQVGYQRLDQNLTPILDKSLEPNELPPYSLVPRNAALVIRFSDLIDEETIQATTIKILTGNPPLVPFDARIIPDINHGDLADTTHQHPITCEQVPGGDGILEFHTTRVIVDTTVSELEAASTNPPLVPNALGLPESVTPNLPNVALRIPTFLAAGQLALVRNLSGHSLSFSQSGSNDPNSPTHDIVRAMRSGNQNDLNNGFLKDEIPPSVIGTQAAALGTVTQNGDEYVVSLLTFTFLDCASRLKEGDILQQPGVFGQVTQTSGDPVGGAVQNVHFRVIFPPEGVITAGPAQVATVFDPSVNFGQQACFVRFSNVLAPPASKVATDSSVIVRFSEPMNPVSVKPFDSFMLTRVADDPQADQFIVGEVTPSSDLRRFTFTPILPYTHTNLAIETYFVTITNGANGPTDLAGNTLLTNLPQISFTIDPNEPTERSAGFALRFSSPDEINNGDGPELRGQFLYDTTAGVLKPRTVSRFAAAATREKPIPSIMPIPPSGVQTPLSPLGSKLQTIWRYCDVGFGLQDESFYNVDVEGLDWAPVGGSVVSDIYDKFEMLLSHSFRLPDESISTQTLLPIYRNSGLVSLYSANVLDPLNDPPKIVHNRNLGYTVDPADRFLSATTPAVTMMPYPMNRNLPVAQHVFYTWRDTAVAALGCPSQNQGCPGAELAIVIQVLNLGGPGGIGPGTPYPKGFVPTVGLPLLMEFRCFPDDDALGLNSFDINIAINSSSLPNFRAFSTGGTNSSGVPVIKNPDSESVATGGFNPTSNPPGQPTIPVDCTFYIGQMDLIIRVSRAHSIWFNTESASPVFSEPVVEPRQVDQPGQARIELAFRGATSVSGSVDVDAGLLDVYGEGGVVAFVNNDKSWKSDLTALQGARYFQTRISFISDAETMLTPILSALGFAFRR